MEMHQLRYVVSVARTGNFSRAAEQCNVSQPALSQQIQKLEEELGERLFDRSHRKARLTQHGERFLARAVHILDEAESAKREASEAKRQLGGVLTVGVLPTIAPYLLPALLGEFMDRHPGLEIVVLEDTTARLLRHALAFEADVVIVSQPFLEKGLNVRPLFTEELYLALPPRHALAAKRRLTSDDLKHERLIVMQEGHCLGDQVLRFCDRREVHPQIGFRSPQLETVQALVSAGLGISLIPAMARQNHQGNGPQYRSLAEPRPEREIVAAWSKQRTLSRSATEFLGLVSARFDSAMRKRKRRGSVRDLGGTDAAGTGSSARAARAFVPAGARAAGVHVM